MSEKQNARDKARKKLIPKIEKILKEHGPLDVEQIEKFLKEEGGESCPLDLIQDVIVILSRKKKVIGKELLKGAGITIIAHTVDLVKK